MIIGLTGSFGAGKGAVVDYLSQRGFKHYSVSEFIKEEIRRRGLPVNRDTMTETANDLRAIHGPAYVIEFVYERAKAAGGSAIIESIRVPAEVHKIKELGGTVIGVDADSKIRYERAVKRGSEKDKVSLEKFLAQEKAESNPDDPAKQDVFGSLQESDFIVTNNGTLEGLHAQIDEVLAKLTT
jgi:dephospho-CoA kinase